MSRQSYYIFRFRRLVKRYRSAIRLPPTSKSTCARPSADPALRNGHLALLLRHPLAHSILGQTERHRGTAHGNIMTDIQPQNRVVLADAHKLDGTVLQRAGGAPDQVNDQSVAYDGRGNKAGKDEGRDQIQSSKEERSISVPDGNVRDQ